MMKRPPSKEIVRRRGVISIVEAEHTQEKMSDEERMAKSRSKSITKMLARRAVGGPIHPTTGDVTYTDREWEFMCAIEDYKAVTNRKFPTWADTLSVIDALGYVKVVAPAHAAEMIRTVMAA